MHTQTHHGKTNADITLHLKCSEGDHTNERAECQFHLHVALCVSSRWRWIIWAQHNFKCIGFADWTRWCLCHFHLFIFCHCCFFSMSIVFYASFLFTDYFGFLCFIYSFIHWNERLIWRDREKKRGLKWFANVHVYRIQSIPGWENDGREHGTRLHAVNKSTG